MTREGTNREGRDCRCKGNGALVGMGPEAAVMDVDTSEASSLRSLIEALRMRLRGVGRTVRVIWHPRRQITREPGGEDLECSKWTQRNKCEVTSVKRERQLGEEK